MRSMYAVSRTRLSAAACSYDWSRNTTCDRSVPARLTDAGRTEQGFHHQDTKAQRGSANASARRRPDGLTTRPPRLQFRDDHEHLDVTREE